MTNYEMTEKLSEKMGITLEEARTALEASGWDMLEAALLLEKEYGAGKAGKTAEKKAVRGCGLLKRLGAFAKTALDMGDRNRFEVRRDSLDEPVLDLPVTVVALLLIFAFWATVPLAVIGLFAGFRYSFRGAELGGGKINEAMDKAAETADKVISELKKDEAAEGAQA